eukprot:11673464-Alexandrium_andersonii.AAC.1
MQDNAVLGVVWGYIRRPWLFLGARSLRLQAPEKHLKAQNLARTCQTLQYPALRIFWAQDFGLPSSASVSPGQPSAA